MDVIRIPRQCPQCDGDGTMTLVANADGQRAGRPVIACPRGHLTIGLYGDDDNPVFEAMGAE